MATGSGPVIVVDDDAAVRHSLKFVLEVEGLDVRLYASGPEVLARGDLRSAGCLVVDQVMPAMTGLELVDRLRDRALAVPVILITAKASDELRARAAARGIDEVIEKPLEDGTLLQSIRRAMAHRRSPCAAAAG